nr:MAG: hypothetical protein [uncultured archaeon]
MGREFRQIGTKNEMHFNIKTWDYLNKITIGLYNKLGLLYPINTENCRIIARIIQNHIIYQRYGNLEREFHNIEYLESGEIEFMKEVALFFKTAKKGIEEIK